ncbi:MAG TPA: EAL domain-containing protein [Candidatus Krumholzibacteria bacterium]|nr:EAL domain-containing protein [Candidatus Krumholzibacteria bacterium]HRX51623.1 EAL domain-containing protein [Candidatus Krumholzibacteria bacterium]
MQPTSQHQPTAPASRTPDAMPRRRSIELLVRHDRVEQIYARSPFSIASLSFVCLVYFYLQLGHGRPQILGAWIGMLAVVHTGRYLLTRLHHRDAERADHPDRWLRRYQVATSLSAVVVGSVSVLFTDGHMTTQQLMSVLVLTGLAAGVMVAVPDVPTQSVYVLCLLGPVTVQYFLQGTPAHYGMASLLLALVVVLLKYGKEHVNHYEASLRFQYENKALVADLKQEKERLDVRLGRILNDGSHELYVMDAESQRCLQVNVGAVRNLGYTEQELRERSLRDFLIDVDQESLRAKIRLLSEGRTETVFLRGRHLRQNGSSYPVDVWLQYSDQEDPPILVATALDITERDEYEQRLSAQANQDQLTGLPNRFFVMSYIEHALRRARRGERCVALLFMDLDNFKTVNDTLGHAAGDELLKQAADRIRSVLRECDTAARLGGDEFLLVLEDLADADQAEAVADKVVQAFSRPFLVASRRLHATASVGVSVFPHDGGSVEELMQNADTAMYQAKTHGRNEFRLFTPAMRMAAEERLLIASHLRRAMERNGLDLAYQPILDMEGGRIVGAEALLRWHSAELGEVPPEQFIPVAESLGLIDALGHYVMRNACREAAAWNHGASLPRYVSINVSPQQFRDPDFLTVVESALLESGLPPELLLLEITESLLIQDAEEPLQIIRHLHELGVRLALDDFGTGYSSLSYLKRFPLQVLKIDRSFVQGVAHDANDRALVEAIIAMAGSLDLEVVGEGVETEAQLEFLRGQGVRLVQGFLYSRPVTSAEIRALVAEGSMVPIPPLAPMV